MVDVAAGGAHSACVTAAGDLYTWGKGRYGRLGHSDSEDQLKPKLVRRHLEKMLRGLGQFLMPSLVKVVGEAACHCHYVIMIFISQKYFLLFPFSFRVDVLSLITLQIGLYSVGHLNRRVFEISFYLYFIYIIYIYVCLY